MARRLLLLLVGFICLCAAASETGIAQAAPANAQHWVAAWTASAQGPYPVGNPTAQPELKFAFPDAERGAIDAEPVMRRWATASISTRSQENDRGRAGQVCPVTGEQ